MDRVPASLTPKTLECAFPLHPDPLGCEVGFGELTVETGPGEAPSQRKGMLRAHIPWRSLIRMPSTREVGAPALDALAPNLWPATGGSQPQSGRRHILGQ